VPSTLKVLRRQSFYASGQAFVELHAGRGEAESAQLLLIPGERPIEGATFRGTDLVGPDGASIRPEIGLVGYVPVTKPSFVGFHRRGAYPDPIMPARPFDVAAGDNQALWYTVWVPREAPPGTYAGSIEIADRTGTSFRISVDLTVHDVTLPVTSFLKTRVNFRRENFRDERYYGRSWKQERSKDLALLGLKYRFSTHVDLPLAAVFKVAQDGESAVDWSDFDAEVEYWLKQGISSFDLDLGITWDDTPAMIHERFGQRLEAIDGHVTGKGWSPAFHFYFYDEPSGWDMKELRSRLEAIRFHAPHIPNILTYGTSTAGQRKLLGQIGTWVPNIHQYDPAFAAARRSFGEESWVYTSVANAFRTYPDNFRIDWYGTAHRALGWWLFKYGADGYLYWAVDLWRSDPWKDAATFPWTNGDGMLFYPAPDRASDPLPSIRAHLMRDAFEDFDLLTLLRRRCEASGDFPDEARRLLSASGLIPARNRFSTDDQAYIDAHRRLLELLEGR
jgi:hypothetical protein